MITEDGNKLLWFDPLVRVEEHEDSYLVQTTRGSYVSLKRPGREFKIIEVRKK